MRKIYLYLTRHPAVGLLAILLISVFFYLLRIPTRNSLSTRSGPTTPMVIDVSTDSSAGHPAGSKRSIRINYAPPGELSLCCGPDDLAVDIASYPIDVTLTSGTLLGYEPDSGLELPDLMYDSVSILYITHPLSRRAARSLSLFHALRHFFAAPQCLPAHALARIPVDCPLTHLNVARNAVDDSDMAAIARIASLENLVLSETKITDSAMASLAQLRQLRTLSIKETNVTSSGLRHLAGLTSLSDLNLEMVPATTADIQRISHLPLEILNLQNTKVDDAVVPVLKSISALREVNLGGTQISVDLLIKLARKRGAFEVWLE